jgi:hypothetical protein
MGAQLAFLAAIVALLSRAPSVQSALRATESATRELQQDEEIRPLLHDCPITMKREDQTAPLLHVSHAKINADMDSRMTKLLTNIAGYNHGWYKTQYLTKLAPPTLAPLEDLLTPPLPNGNLVFWGNNGKDFEMTLWNNETMVDRSFGIPSDTGYHLNLTPRAYKHDLPTMELQGPGNFVVLTSLFVDQFQHVLIDHLGYLAYLKDMLSPDTQFVLLFGTSRYNQNKNRFMETLEYLDPDFAHTRVTWMECGANNFHKCNQSLHVSNGGTIQVATHASSARHGAFLEHARRWILEAYSRHPPLSEERSIVYYTRRGEAKTYDRSMDEEQEEKMIQTIAHMMERFERKEQLVVFDGNPETWSVVQQIELFRSASVVIGPHGGGMANMIWMEPNCDSNRRFQNQVLEFITSYRTLRLQQGSMQRSYFQMYAKAPWIREYHQILYTSSRIQRGYDSTFVDLETFRGAVLQIFGKNIDNERGSVVDSKYFLKQYAMEKMGFK